MSTIQAQKLQNKHWQVGILPQTGASIAFGRVRYEGIWLDVMRPTRKADYGNASLSSCFLMIPWSNRIRDGRFRFDGRSYQLGELKSDGTAMHGAVRQRGWSVGHVTETSIQLAFDSARHKQVNFPFRFRAEVIYQLDEADFMMTIKIRNVDHRVFPAGFGLHPYFVRGAGAVQLSVPCAMNYELDNALPTRGYPQSLPKELDFRALRALDAQVIDDVFTARIDHLPAQIVYPEWNLRLAFYADALFKHFVLYTPANQPFFALEPITNANDGFNLYDDGMEDTGVFLLEPGQEKQGTASLRLEPNHS